MREITTSIIEKAVYEGVIKANICLPNDVKQALEIAAKNEKSHNAKKILEILLENADIAVSENLPLCQDTGLVAVDIELGQDIQIRDGYLIDAVHNGIKKGYENAYFRKSIVNNPFDRINTGNNTPAVTTINIFPDDRLNINLMPKGAGSENMGKTAMLKPSEGIEGVKKFVLNVVKDASSNPCPPIIVGVGVGGNMEKASYLAKKALFREITVKNSNSPIALLEQELLQEINELGIGPQGLGGDNTALAVNMEVYPTHIASLPVAVNISCHCTRRVKIVL